MAALKVNVPLKKWQMQFCFERKNALMQSHMSTAKCYMQTVIQVRCGLKIRGMNKTLKLSLTLECMLTLAIW